MKAVILSIDILIAILIFLSAIYAFNITASESNNPALLYYDSSNALKFIENELANNNITGIESLISHYLGNKNYYIKIEYYNESGIFGVYEIGSKEHENNYCSSKEYFVNGKIINSMLCLWEDAK